MQFIQIQTTKLQLQVEPEWLKLIEFVKSHPYSELTITFKAGKPDTAVNVKESLKF